MMIRVCTVDSVAWAASMTVITTEIVNCLLVQAADVAFEQGEVMSQDSKENRWSTGNSRVTKIFATLGAYEVF